MAELNQRTAAMNAVRRISDRVKRLQSGATDVYRLEQDLQSLSSHYTRFLQYHEQLVGLAKKEELDAHEQLGAEIEDTYNDACAALNRAIKPQLSASTGPRESDLRLDPLVIPKFDGTTQNWLAFKDTFEALVHNASYPEAYKLGKLRQAVSASDVPLIGSMYAGGYTEVWTALKERFDNRKRLAETHVARLLNVQATGEDTSRALLDIVDTVRESLRALAVMGLPVTQWDALVVPIIATKLPPGTRHEWNMSCSPTKIPLLEELLKFLEQRAQSLGSDAAIQVTKPEVTMHHQRVRLTPRIVRTHVTTTDPMKCGHCRGGHRIMRCSAFLAMRPEQRIAAARAAGLCFNCLKPGHTAGQCPSGECRQCQGKHNTLLCRNASSQSGHMKVTAAASSRSSPAPTSPITTCLAHAAPMVLLATARVLAHGSSTTQRMARVLCDPGSQVSFVTEQFANSLSLRRNKYDVPVEGIGAHTYARTKGCVSVTLSSLQCNFEITIEALVIPSITSDLPTAPIDMKRWLHLTNLELADTHFGTPGRIDVLIGADVWGRLVEADVVSGDLGEPHAQRTRFGWVVFGPTSAAQSPTLPTLAFSTQLREEDVDLEELVRQFWKLEDVPAIDVAEEECARVFSATHSRMADGRYVVQIPFRMDAPQLGESYMHALRQFHWLERKLASDEQLRQKYVAFMREYQALEHMERAPPLTDGTPNYHIPHHAVTGKFRVVFNASARTTTGVSLNDTQLVGEPIQEPLVNIVYRFRRFKIALSADVEKMFRQVLVTPEHRDFQRIIWRESPNDEICVYRLKTVTYGMACSPFNAVRALQQCAYDNFDTVEGRQQSIAARDSILTSFYVDDFLTSCDSESAAVELANNVTTILAAGKFALRKWCSNSSEVLGNLIGHNPSATELAIDSPTAAVLGLRWHPVADEMFFNVNTQASCPTPTKRLVLSAVAKLFDPTGMLAPVVITGKIFIQTLWSEGLAWDAPLPDTLRDTWLTFYNELPLINQIKVPRWLGMTSGGRTSLLGFCDASMHAYAAVIYVRTIDNAGSINVEFLTARTKVAPLKGATIPRLELCAAHLLAILLENVRIALGLLDTPYYLWSDSRVVLCWLKKQPTSLKPYVSNRVRHIQELTSPACWRYVPSSENPADCASRGLRASELIGHTLWWRGPRWLANDVDTIMSSAELSREELGVAQEEQRLRSLTTHALHAPTLSTRDHNGQVIALSARYSSLLRLTRTVAFMLRWTPQRKHLRSQILNPAEMSDALEVIIRAEQQDAFAKEILHIQKGHAAAKLLSLNAYLDDKQILRVGDRIGHAELPHDRRFPIILPKHGNLVQLIMRQAHETTLHGGTQLTLQALRSRYWILKGRQLVRSYVQRCVICRRHQGATMTQQMAPLPKQRIQALRPFAATGVDYCGPFTVRIGTKRSRTTVKTYLAIFVCMATKAVHIEVVDDLSSQAFLDAFTRFVSRRGPCHDLYSDNGTAFVGANRLLHEDLTAWQSDNNQQALAHLGTHWHFNAPSAPHQGGLWEAAVKSAKRHLVRLVGAQVLWRSQLQTLAARIEACLNSRPLTPLYDDPDDKLALTPGDLLLGTPLVAVAEPDVSAIPTSRIKQWLWLRQLHQQFWKRWSEEYLSTLQTRSKWQRKSDGVNIGDIVLVKNENLPPTHWRLGRVTAVHPGADGLARNVTLKTANGSVTRAVQKLCLLLDSDCFESKDSTGQDVPDLAAQPT